MKNELVGRIVEIWDEETGLILGEDKKYYLFTKADFLDNLKLSLNIEVIFKPAHKKLGEEKINKAILIELK